MQDVIGTAMRIIDDARDAVAPPGTWPAGGRLHVASLAGVEARAALGQSMLKRIDALAGAELPAVLARTLAVLRGRAI